jgi:hypothetical protein
VLEGSYLCGGFPGRPHAVMESCRLPSSAGTNTTNPVCAPFQPWSNTLSACRYCAALSLTRACQKKIFLTGSTSYFFKDRTAPCARLNENPIGHEGDSFPRIGRSQNPAIV